MSGVLKQEYLDLLSFAGFFGSIKCFKHLLIKGFEINDNVFLMVLCGGCFDLYHLYKVHQFETQKHVIQVIKFFHLPLLSYMIENGADINAQSIGMFSTGTPLHYAAQNGHLSVVEYLVNQKAEINVKDTCVEFLYLIGLLFIMLLIMVILVLLNI